MFKKFLVFISLSLISNATVMTSNKTEDHPFNQQINASIYPEEEQAAPQQRIITLKRRDIIPGAATNKVYFNEDLWRNIRSYLEMEYMNPSHNFLNKLLTNTSSYLETYLFAPHLTVFLNFSPDSCHLRMLSQNTFFDTVSIHMPYSAESDFYFALRNLMNSLFPRKVTISSRDYKKDRFWTWSFETIDRKRHHHREGINVSHFDRDIHDSIFEHLTFQTPLIYEDNFKINSLNLNTFINMEEYILDKSSLDEIIHELEKSLFSPGIHLEVTKKFSVFSLKQ